MPVAAARKTLVYLADGRELIYFDAEDGQDRAAYKDARPLGPRPGSGESRFDPLLGEWVAVAANRQVRLRGRRLHLRPRRDVRVS